MSLDKTKKLLILFFICISVCFGQTKKNGFSLMGNKEAQSYNDEHPDIFYISCIIFYDKNNWIIWINDEKRNSSQNLNLPFNVEVFPDHLLIKTPSSEKEIKLFANQTIDLKQNKTYNGDCRKKIKKKYEEEEKLSTDGEDFDF